MIRYITIPVFLLFFMFAVTNCKKEPSQKMGNSKYRIAVIEALQETNSFSPVPTNEEQFLGWGPILTGKDIIPFSKKEKMELCGFIDAVAELGNGQVEIVPILKARSVSGGPIDSHLYKRFRKIIVDSLKKAGKLDGVYLSLHGAMGVEGMIDPEGDLLLAVRSVLGEKIPIGVSHDLHSCITKKRAQLATFIVGYKTNPHRDFYDVGYKVGEILIGTARGEIQPTMVVKKMKLLKGGGMNIDFLSPMRKIFSRMKDMEKEPGVLSVSNFMVHLWIDVPELGWTTVAVTDSNKQLAEKLANEIAEMNWAVRSVQPPQGNTPEEAVEIAKSSWLLRKLGAIIFCDVSDAVGTGTPGENTWILKAIMDKAPELISYIPVRDSIAAGSAFVANLHDMVTVSVGGRLDKVYNKPVEFTGELIYKNKGRLGKIVILKKNGIHLIITELPDSTSQPKYFTDMGLNLWKADIVVVKNLFPFRYYFLLYNRKTVNVVSPGISNIDVFQLKYKNITRPLYPLDDINDWR